jgi:hypothetical protein
MKPIYLFILIPVAFVGMWAGVTALLSFLSGWTSLARSYRGTLASVENSVGMGSGIISRFGLPVSYNHVLNVSVGGEGVELSLFPLFALTSPRLLIPWSDMAECRSYRALGMFDRFSFRPARCGVKIALAGNAARMLAEAATRDVSDGPRPAGALAAR